MFSLAIDLDPTEDLGKAYVSGDYPKGQVRLEKVTDVIPAGRAFVYDLSIGGTENFYAEGFCVHNTRWHSLDLTGYLLDEMENDPEADQWERISLPALAERRDVLGRKPGEALWPKRFNETMLDQIRITLSAQEGPRSWLCLYQQTPVEEQGSYFRRDWFDKTYYPSEIKDKISPEALSARAASYFHIYGASDYAVDKDIGDYTVHLIAGVDPQGDLFLLDLWRERTDSDKWVEAAIDLMERYKPLCWAEEGGQINRSIGPFLQKRMRERQVYCRREQFSSTVDKAARIRSIQARLSSGRVWLPKGVSWAAELVHECTHFPSGPHDDIVDAMGLIGRMLDTMSHGRSPAERAAQTMTKTTFFEYKKALRVSKMTGRRMGGIVV